MKAPALAEPNERPLESCVFEGIKLGAYQNCLVEVCEAKSTDNFEALVRKLDEMLGVLSARYPEGVALLLVVAPGAPFPSSSDRKLLEGFFTRWSAQWRAVARVGEGTDLAGIAARTVMTALRLVRRSSYAENTCSNTNDAAEWIAKYITPRPGATLGQTTEELRQTIKQVRSVAG